MGPVYQDNDLVVAQEDGTIWPPDRFTEGFIRLVKRTGLGKVRFHDLRHSHATQLLVQGVHPKVVSERLGAFDGEHHARCLLARDTGATRGGRTKARCSAANRHRRKK